MKIVVIGAGAFGQVLGGLATLNGHAVTFYDPYKFPRNTLKKVLKNAELTFFAAPAGVADEVCAELPLGAPLVSACKGFLTLMPFRNFADFTAIGGAGFADDFAPILAPADLKINEDGEILTENTQFSAKNTPFLAKNVHFLTKNPQSSAKDAEFLAKNAQFPVSNPHFPAKSTEKSAKNDEKSAKIGKNRQKSAKNHAKLAKIGENWSKNSKNTAKMPKITLTTSSKLATEVLKNPHLNFELTNDTLGITLCGALKNIYALGAGLLGGASSELYFEQALIEMRQILEVNGANPKTVAFSCGEADLRKSCTEQSRNFNFGQKIALLEVESLSDQRIYGKITPKTLRARQNLSKLVSKQTVESIAVIKSLVTDAIFAFPPSARLFVTIVNQMQPYVDTLRTAEKSTRKISRRRVITKTNARVKNLGVSRKVAE